MKKILLPLTILSMSAALSACGMHNDNTRADNAPPPPPPPGDMRHPDWDHKEQHMRMMTEAFFNQMDKNGDGVVTRKEYNDYTSKWFREADVNHNGKLTLEEVKAQMKRDKQKMMPPRHMNNDDTQQDGNGNYDGAGYNENGIRNDQSDSYHYNNQSNGY